MHRTSTAAAPGTRRCGHTQASFAEAPFRAHLLGGLRTAARHRRRRLRRRRARRRRPPSDFEITHARRRHREPDGARRRQGRPRALRRAHHRRGQRHQARRRRSLTAGRDPGLRACRRTASWASPWTRTSTTNNNFYVAYTPLPDSSTETRISRFTLTGDTLDAQPRERVDLRDATTSARSAATPPARWPSASTAASTCRPATTRTRSPPTASTRSTSARAARSGTPSARRPTRTPTAARSCASCRSPTRPGRASARATRSRPATSSTRPRTRPEDAARDLRDGLPQPVPDHGRPDTRARC